MTTSIVKLHPDDEPRTVTAGYYFPPARPTTVPPAHLCEREDLQDVAAGAAQHHEQLWALLGSSEHVKAICRDYSESEYRHAREVLALQRQLAAAQGVCVALQTKLETNRNAARVLVAQRDRMALDAGSQRAENASLRRELTAALAPRMTASIERVTVTVSGESYAVVAQRLTAAVYAVDEKFDQSEAIDVPQVDGKPLVEMPDVHSEPVQSGPVVDPDETLDMEPEEEEGGEG